MVEKEIRKGTTDREAVGNEIKKSRKVEEKIMETKTVRKEVRKESKRERIT